MSYYLLLALIVAGYMTLWFIVSLVQKRNDVADVAWGLGFVLLTWTAFFLGGEAGARGVVVNLLVSLWGLRLAWHINRRHQGKPEDARYAAWRLVWGKWFVVRSYLQVFLLQGALLFLVASPLLIIGNSAGPALTLLDLLGVLVWIVGFTCESVADAQLARFLSDPANAGKLMQSGLWRYSRHPNYFGEITQWWGIWLVALSVPAGLYGIIGPLTITILILFVSGVPLVEKRYAGRADFEDYKRRTSVLVPLPPRAS
jgi:steroid 5-alpha reductase family enzyme